MGVRGVVCVCMFFQPAQSNFGKSEAISYVNPSARFVSNDDLKIDCHESGVYCVTAAAKKLSSNCCCDCAGCAGYAGSLDRACWARSQVLAGRASRSGRSGRLGQMLCEIWPTMRERRCWGCRSRSLWRAQDLGEERCSGGGRQVHNPGLPRASCSLTAEIVLPLAAVLGHPPGRSPAEACCGGAPSAGR
jgi:hypothetical protein